ncbi:MAG: hypothetical protein JWR00_3896 [Rubritepida sp.]|nr:hypothetical protein [Rubritepida sp.]
MSQTSRRDLAALSVATAAVGLALATDAAAQPAFPNLTEAEGHLSAALEALRRAPDRFGGHKAEAMRLIQAALAEIQQAKRAFR